jgi:hypothetical protein
MQKIETNEPEALATVEPGKNRRLRFQLVVFFYLTFVVGAGILDAYLILQGELSCHFSKAL